VGRAIKFDDGFHDLLARGRVCEEWRNIFENDARFWEIRHIAEKRFKHFLYVHEAK